MRVIVTGASGFLGTAILRELNTIGIDCRGVSRKEKPGLLTLKSYADAPSGDVLIHLAEINDRGLANTMPADYEREVMETLNNLSKKRYRKIVYISSAVVYKATDGRAHKETDLGDPVDTYTRIKLTSEKIVLEQQFGSVVRLANAYGPGMTSNNVVWDILKQIGKPGPIKVIDVKPVRDFIWIGDAANGIAKLAIGTPEGIFNLGTGVGTSVGQLATMLLQQANQNMQSISSMKPHTRPSQVILDIKKAKQNLGWVPLTNIECGLSHLMKQTSFAQQNGDLEKRS